MAGVDVGGTFTDAVIFDEQSGKIRRTKVLTTAHDQSEGTVQALGRLTEDPADIDSFHHGYTVGINAALTRQGAKAGMLVTAGHRETLDTGRIWRPFDENLYDPTWQRPHLERPLIPRRFRREVPERMREDGEVVLELDEAATRRELEFLKAEGVESVAICFINAYEHPGHEERVREIVVEVMPDAYVQTSQIWPLPREFERSFVVALDAYAGPPIVKYLERLEARLAAEGYSADLQIMQMDGGLRTGPSVRKSPVYTLQSGPVAGLLGAEYYSRELLDGQGLVCLDIGGTSSDIGVIHQGQSEVTNEWQLEHAIPLSITTLDVRSIGAGGGSLIQVDELGSLSVGPESAGSEPGPACYGRGGNRPTMTDAYVHMGILQPDLFLGGEMPLDREAAERALQSVADTAGMSATELAEGAYRITNTKIAAAIRALTVERGLDLRDFALFAYGAAGPMHGVGVARELGFGEVVVPYFPGGFSAFGMISSRSRVEYSKATLAPLESLSHEALNELLDRLAGEAREDLRSQGIAEDEIEIEHVYYGMYTGQSEPNRLPLPPLPLSAEDLAGVAADFHEFYDRRFGYRAPDIPITVTSVAAIGLGPTPNVDLMAASARADGSRPVGIDQALIREAPLDFGGHHENGRFYTRAKLATGDVVEGPAVIDDELGTIVVNDYATVHVEEHGTLRIRLFEESDPEADRRASQ